MRKVHYIIIFDVKLIILAMVHRASSSQNPFQSRTFSALLDTYQKLADIILLSFRLHLSTFLLSFTRR